MVRRGVWSRLRVISFAGELTIIDIVRFILK